MIRPILAAIFISLSVAPAATGLDFNRDIRPILSDNCFNCHGINAKSRKAELRLDVPEGAYAKNKKGRVAVVAKSPDSSELIKRILSKDADELMPPPESHKKLTAKQIETLRQWISEGAGYKKHWAFELPVKFPVPRSPFSVAAAKDDGAKSEAEASMIDGFLAAKLAENGLTFSPEAKPEEFIRRVTLDLTGFPPTPKEVNDFLIENREHPQASIEHLVARLQQSPRYGENMARYWLDAARYGDTHGLHLDNERSIWPYRDWVVKAFNENKPFDQFTIEQLAGDLLPNPTVDQLVATGFSRCNVTTSEGGAINEEWVHRYAVDRTETMMSVWLGLTAGCSVCHDHKFDPITQKDFYSLYAFFNSAADPAMDGNILLTQPIVRLSTAEQKKQTAALEASIAAKQALIRDAISKLEYKDPATQTPPPPVQTSETVWFEDSFPPTAKVESSGGEPTKFVTKEQGSVFSGKAALTRTATGVAQDFFAGGVKLDIPPNGKFSVYAFIDPKNPPKSIMVQFHTTGWTNRVCWGEEGAIPFGKVRTSEHVYLGALPEAGSWQKLEFTAEKAGLKPGMKITGYAFTQFGGTVSWDHLSVSSRVNPAQDPQWSWAKWIEKNQGKRVEGLPNDLLTLVRGKKAEEWGADTKRVQDWWFENEYQGARSLVDGARAEKLAEEAKKKALEDAIPASFIMGELPEKRDAFVMVRGQYDKPGEKVSRNVPAIFPQLPKKENYDRLDLAKWLVSPQHPLTARVYVNRLWQQFFGLGLVKTSNDFGSQGEPPTHPELLDTLAVDFREHGWDVKRLVKLIVTSKAYRQSAVRISDSRILNPDSPQANAGGAESGIKNQKSGIADDPENRLLSYFPRRRLDAEVLRDQALFVSGLLDPTMGGKGVRPYQPDNIWEPVAYSGSNTRSYIRDTGSALYRRSLYTFYKRTAPPPSMTTFDAPSREQYCLRRERSNTPMQALNLMNDIQHMEAARNFAQRVLTEGGATFDTRLNFLWRTVLARFPKTDEASIVEQTLAQHLKKYQANAEAAKQLITFGDSKPDAKLNPSELAAWTMVANLVLNLDEAVCN